MANGHEPTDRRASRGEERGAEDGDVAARPEPELRWVQLRHPRHAVEIGRNGRVLDSRYHSGYDSWEVLLETYEGELSD